MAFGKRRGTVKDEAPNLFGPYGRTSFLIELASVGVARRGDLAKHFGLDMIRPRVRDDRSGLVLSWSLGQRGTAVALNPHYPLLRELRSLLRALSVEYGLGITTTLTAREGTTLPTSVVPESDLTYLFHTPLRTATLVALEALGGQTTLINLAQCAPKQFYHSVVTAVNHFVKERVLERDGEGVRFRDRSWTQELRNLLRAYLRVDRRTHEEIRRDAAAERARPRKYDKFELLGPKNVERALIALAQNGPMSYARVMAMSKTSADAGIAVFERMGLVLSHRDGRRRILSLNRRHPIYREFRALLISIGGPTTVQASRDLAHDADFRIDNLFGKDLRTAVLLTLRAERCGEMDAASVCRLLPQHDGGKVRAALRRFHKIGVVTRRRWKTLVYYSFNEEYTHYEALQALLSGAIRHWPAYKSAAATSKYLYSPERKALHPVSVRAEHAPSGGKE